MRVLQVLLDVWFQDFSTFRILQTLNPKPLNPKHWVLLGFCLGFVDFKEPWTLYGSAKWV